MDRRIESAIRLVRNEYRKRTHSIRRCIFEGGRTRLVDASIGGREIRNRQLDSIDRRIAQTISTGHDRRDGTSQAVITRSRVIDRTRLCRRVPSIDYRFTGNGGGR